MDLLRKEMRKTVGPFVFQPIENGPWEFDAILARPGIPKVNELREVLTIHSLRHTFGTLQAEAGLNQFGLMAILGHSRLETTTRYVNPTAPAAPVAVVELLPGRWQ